MAKPKENPMNIIKEEIKSSNIITNNISGSIIPIKPKKEPVEYIAEKHIVALTPKRKETSATRLDQIHDPMIISLIYGGLLGDLYARKGVCKTLLNWNQSHIHKEYLWDLHRIFANLGYCNTKVPIIKERVNSAKLKNGENRKVVYFTSYSYESFNIIHSQFYPSNKEDKSLPLNIAHYLDPLAMAIWVADDGSKSGSGLILCSDCFTLDEIHLLINAIKINFNINCHERCIREFNPINNKPAQYRIYIPSNSMKTLREILFPVMPVSMLYKIGKDLSKDLKWSEEKILDYTINHPIYKWLPTTTKMVPLRKYIRKDKSDIDNSDDSNSDEGSTASAA